MGEIGKTITESTQYNPERNHNYRVMWKGKGLVGYELFSHKKTTKQRRKHEPRGVSARLHVGIDKRGGTEKTKAYQANIPQYPGCMALHVIVSVCAVSAFGRY